jgi:hypothetical protein
MSLPDDAYYSDKLLVSTEWLGLIFCGSNYVW